MKTEKSLKTIKTALVVVATAIAVLSITLMAIFIPKNKIVNAATEKGADKAQAQQTIAQIERLEAEYQQAFDENSELWEKYFAEFQKLEELPEDFDEKAFINGLTTLTLEEKETLLKNVDVLDDLDAKLQKLYDELFDADEYVAYDDCENGNCDFAETDEDYFADNGCGYDVLFIECDENFFGDDFGRLCDEAEQVNKEVQALRKEFDDLMDARKELWDKVFESYDQLDENFDYADFDEVKYIAQLDTLTAEEKETLIADIAKLDEISAKIASLFEANCGR